MRIGTLSTRDTTVSVWEESVNENELKQAVMDPFIRFLRSKGWKIGRCPRIYKQYRILNKWNRYCRKGGLEASLSLSGRTLKFEIYQNVANVENTNGGQYDFDKLEKMPYLLRQHARVAMQQAHSFLSDTFGYRPPAKKEAVIGPGKMTALDAAQHMMENSGHYQEHLGRANWHSDYNRKSADGELIEHGQQVFFRDCVGRIGIGQAFYNLNSAWYVVTGKYTMSHVMCSDIYINNPGNLKAKRNASIRRRRLEKLMAKAISEMQFLRAEQLKNILFGKEPLYLIYKDDRGYFGPNYSGYTSSPTHAGKYTQAELEASGYFKKNETRSDIHIKPIAA